MDLWKKKPDTSDFFRDFAQKKISNKFYTHCYIYIYYILINYLIFILVFIRGNEI